MNQILLICNISIQIMAIDINRETYEVGLPVMEKAAVAHKIDFQVGSALTILEKLLTEVKKQKKTFVSLFLLFLFHWIFLLFLFFPFIFYFFCFCFNFLTPDT